MKNSREGHKTQGRRDVARLEALIEAHDLICNNESGRTTRLTRGQTTSTIDVTFTTLELGVQDC